MEGLDAVRDDRSTTNSSFPSYPAIMNALADGISTKLVPSEEQVRVALAGTLLLPEDKIGDKTFWSLRDEGIYQTAGDGVR